MPIDNERETLVEALSERTRGYVGDDAVTAALHIISELTVIGPAIIHSLRDMATKRLWERATEMFQRFDEDLRSVEEEKINKEFFKTEEFQTLLFLSIEQLRTTHDKGKQRMIASALVNSSLMDFALDDRKELFLRILRDLTPPHIQVLKKLSTSFVPGHHISIQEPRGQELAILQHLTANGLVEQFATEHPTVSIPWSGQLRKSDVQSAVKHAIQEAAKRNFRINAIGLDFLKYIESPLDAPKV